METIFSLHIFPSPPNDAHARPNFRLTSSSHRPSSVITPPMQIYKPRDLLRTAALSTLSLQHSILLISPLIPSCWRLVSHKLAFPMLVSPILPQSTIAL